MICGACGMYTEFNFKSQRTEAIPMRTFHLNSLRNKLIIFLLTSMILPISISILITYLYTKESIKSNYIRENSNLIHQGAINFRNYEPDRQSDAARLQQPVRCEQPVSVDSKRQRHVHGRAGNVSQFAVCRQSVKEIEQIYLYSAAEDTSYRQ